MDDPEKSAEGPEVLFKMWPRIGFLLTLIGGAFAYVVGNWSVVEPVLSSPAMVLIALLSVYGLGGLSSYWLVARPLEHRLGKAEGVINRLRDRERELGGQITELRVNLARLEARLEVQEA
tara:strand:- start:10225 stop:10584 length:360 start_codon:yes stop_codon:yes gene_type:complete